MCGIAGIIDGGAGFGRRELAGIARAMRDTLVHRGPDDAGIWVDDAGVCALAHRRLAIIDLGPEGRQPMTDEAGDVAVTFNGEIYNFAELRRDLERHGHRFRSRTDTEVLPHLFETMDPAEVERLDGMFAFAVWHQRQRRLLLARDPFGKKPLYYAAGPGWFAFASELAALRQVPGYDNALDEEALGFYLLQGYVPAPWSIHRGARKLPPGSWLTLSLGGGRLGAPTIRSFTRFAPRRPGWLDRFRSLASLEETLRELVIQAVRKRLVSDVPLGAFLSGGVDSSLVAAVMVRELGVPVRTFSIGFANTDETEHHHARAIARHLGTEHHDEVLRPDAIELVHDVAHRLDEPNGDGSCLPTYLLSRFAREQVTVALSGDGGDELFGGYRRYQDTLQESGWRQGPANRYLNLRWLTHLPEQVRELLGGLPSVVADQLADWRRRLDEPALPVIHRLRQLDAGHYLPGAVLAKVDRMSMQVSLEVRCPLLDRELARFAETLPAHACWRAPDQTKRLLKRLASRYLPPPWMHRPKMGFGIPTQAWSKDRLVGLARDLIASPSSRLGHFLLPGALRRWVDEQAHQFSIYQTWPLLILELWLRGEAASRPLTHIANRARTGGYARA